MKEIINKGFYCSLRNFVIASTNFLQKVEVSGARRPTKEVYLLKLKEDSFSESGHSVSWGHSKIRSSEPDLRQFGMIYYEEIRKLKEVRECINLSIQINEIRNELSKERGVDSALNKIFEESILKRLLMEYLWEANSLQFNEEVFVDIYKKLNRKGERFKCLRCGHQDDADYNRSINIRSRFTQDNIVPVVSKLAA